MKAILSEHAILRIKERCRLSVEQLCLLLDEGAWVPVQFQRKARLIQKLIYSSADQNWFLVVQNGGDGGVLTIMPWTYLTGASPVTAAKRRQARSKALNLESSKATPQPSPTTEAPRPASSQQPAQGWKFQTWSHVECGGTRVVALGRTQPELGEPEDWLTPGMIHQWLKERILDAGVPLREVRHVYAVRGKIRVNVSFLLEHLPMTQSEIESIKA